MRFDFRILISHVRLYIFFCRRDYAPLRGFDRIILSVEVSRFWKGEKIMLKSISKLALVVLVAFGLFGLTFVPKAEAKGKAKVGFFTKISRKIKRKVRHVAKKTRRAIGITAAGVQDKVMDAGVAVKKAITGKKHKTHVRGHYKTHQKSMTNGHFRRVQKHKHSGGAAPAPAPAPANPGAAPADPAFPQ